MAEYLSPGVYVEEYDNSQRSIEGVGTSTAGFVGMAQRGPVKGAPTLITSFANFQRTFGGYLSEYEYRDKRFLASSVEQFFTNGGRRCYVSRVIPEGAKAAEGTQGILRIQASSEGSWGNRVQVTVRTVKKKKLILRRKFEDGSFEASTVSGLEEGALVIWDGKYNTIAAISDNRISFTDAFQGLLEESTGSSKGVPYLVEAEVQIQYGDTKEAFTELNFRADSVNYIVNRLKSSELVTVEIQEAEKAKKTEEAKEAGEAKEAEAVQNPIERIFGEGAEEGVISLSGGSDGSIDKADAGMFIGTDEGPGERTGIASFQENDQISMLAVPGITEPSVVTALVAHCENMADRFAVIDMPFSCKTTDKLLEYRELIDTTYGAMYHPWIQNFDRTTQKPGYFPPSGAVMGVYARTDISRGVHKAPANETISCTGLSVNFNTGEQDILNPEGINLIRKLPGQGVRIWGARTAGSNSTFKYVNVRRLFIYIEKSIKTNTGWVVFEPNDATLWERVRISISSFLNTVWRSGMLAGATEEESYFVEIGESTMTQDDILSGRLICNIGIAPSRPAEFVIFRITQYTARSE